VTILSWKDVGGRIGRPLVEALLAVVLTEVLVVVVRDSSSQIPMRCDYSTFGSVPVSSSSDGPCVSILLSLLIHASYSLAPKERGHYRPIHRPMRLDDSIWRVDTPLASRNPFRGCSFYFLIAL